MFVFVRAVTYSTLFIGLVLVYVPARLLSWSGLVRPVAMEVQQVVGMVIGAAGSAVALWCIFAFASVGKGTPAPFDPPRRLVIRGPYRFVRNPMYIGAGLALAGAALFYESLPLLGYISFFFLNADANRDRAVNAMDFNALASHFGAISQSFAEGDFTSDGIVNTFDFTALATQFNKTLPPPPAAPLNAPAQPTASLFGAVDIASSAVVAEMDTLT